MKTILFTGDSITDGNRYKNPDQAWDLNHQMGHSFAYIVNGILGSMYPEKDYHFINRGISGNRVIDLYARLDRDLLSLKPDIVSFLVGVNDGPGDPQCLKATPAEKYDAIYRMMLEEIKASLPETAFVFCGPFVCNAGRLKPDYPKWRKCMEEYAAAVKQIALDYEGIYIPLQEKFDEACRIREAEYWCWDGVHPTENGHGIIAREWMEKTAGLL